MSAETDQFAQRIVRIEALVADIEQSSDDMLREATREIVGNLLELHAAGLKRIFELLSSVGELSNTAMELCANDDLVRSLLLLHDLHPEGMENRVRQALDKVRPYLHSHGGDVELLEVSPAGVRLRMEGSCNGCPSSAATLRDSIERAIFEFAPDVGEIKVEGVAAPAPPPIFVPLELPINGHNPAREGANTDQHQLARQES